MKSLRRIARFLFIQHRLKSLLLLLCLGIWYACCLPRSLFSDPESRVLLDRKGQLLGARIAADGQWRFPQPDSVPAKFKMALLEFEDRRFYQHPGIDPLSIARAIKQNIRNGRIVSGGSTLSMQLIRMSRKGKPRTFFQKGIEIIMATRLELAYSKEEILKMYAAHAPFGGNVVGLDAASWRYYGKSAHHLSWAEAATLAVLPNSPALIHPGRNRQALLAKRNRLLDRLLKAGLLNALSNELAKEEPLPEQPIPLPRLAPQLMDRFVAKQKKQSPGSQSLIRSTIDGGFQKQVYDILQRHLPDLKANGIHNLAAVIMDVEQGNVLAYVGNAMGTGSEHGEAVDIIPAPRSTGSILKPLLYALMQQGGELLPNSLVPDIPTFLHGYQPQNYHNDYDGLVGAGKALIRSLNVPMVRMLQKYSVEKFHFHLQKLGFRHINKPPNHYGLTLILGGAEASLWDVSNTYNNMSRTLLHFYENDGLYHPLDFREARPEQGPEPDALRRDELLTDAPFLSAGAIWLAYEKMQQVERPDEFGAWQKLQSSRQIAWKTGTSFGFRDAWAVGTTPSYTVGVWAGNADGEGRPGLVGVKAAAPVLFDIFSLLPATTWFEQPFDEMLQIEVCRQSGYRATELCPVDSVWACKAGLNSRACPFHQLIHLDKTEHWQVNSSCASPADMRHKSWFVLPPVEEYYYKSKVPAYRPLPPVHPDCRSDFKDPAAQPMEFIYPAKASQIFVPIELDGSLGSTIFKVAHRNPAATIHWHLDYTYLGSTTEFHQMELQPIAGPHSITVVDEGGNSLVKRFEIYTHAKLE